MRWALSDVVAIVLLGAWDVISWAALALVVAVSVRHALRR